MNTQRFEIHASHITLIHVVTQLHVIIFGPGTCSNNGRPIEIRAKLKKMFGNVRLAGLDIETRMLNDLAGEAVVKPVGWPKDSLIKFELLSCRNGGIDALDTFLWHGDIVTIRIPGLFECLCLGTMDLPPFFTTDMTKGKKEEERRLFVKLLEDVQYTRVTAV